MEWYDWVFAFCGASMAFATAVMSAQVYSHFKGRAAGGDRTARRRTR